MKVKDLIITAAVSYIRKRQSVRAGFAIKTALINSSPETDFDSKWTSLENRELINSIAFRRSRIDASEQNFP